MSLFGSLNIGYQGLMASQLSMDVTGQNITNANTDGYSRKRATVSASSRKDDMFGQLGNGVESKNVTRVRNEFVDYQINQAVSSRGYFETMDDALSRVENIFTEPSDNALNQFLDDFWNSWQDLANNPADLSAREAVKTTTQVMTAQFHSLSTELHDYKLQINNMIEAEIGEVNDLLNDISQLNDEIAIIELTENKMANDSRDQRELAMKELAEKIDVDFYEDGDGRVTVTTFGNIIVGPREVVPLELYRRTATTDAGQDYSEVFARFSNTKKEYDPQNGMMKGLFEIRDEKIVQYEDALDEMAKVIVEAVNGVHYSGYDMDEDTGTYYFDPTKLTADTITLSPEVLNDTRNIAAAQGGKVETPFGTPLPGTVPAGSRTIDVTDPLQDPSYNPRYQSLIPGSVQIFMGGVELVEGPGSDYVVDYSTGQIFFNNAATVPDGSAVDIEFQYNDSPFGGVGDGSNALAVLF